MINKSQFRDLQSLLKTVTNTDTIITEAQNVLGIDPRNPSQVAKLLNELKLGEVGLKFVEGIPNVTIDGHTATSSDQSVALLKALIAAIEARALDAIFPEKKSRDGNKAMTPGRGFERPMERR